MLRDIRESPRIGQTSIGSLIESECGIVSLNGQATILLLSHSSTKLPIEILDSSSIGVAKSQF